MKSVQSLLDKEPVKILQSEESKFQLKTESSSDWRLPEKIPHSAGFLWNKILQSEESECHFDKKLIQSKN